MRKALLLLATMSVGACGSGPEIAVIVAVSCEVRKGEADCKTIVETSDRARYIRSDDWGAVGDTVLIERSYQRWVSP